MGKFHYTIVLKLVYRTFTSFGRIHCIIVILEIHEKLNKKTPNGFLVLETNIQNISAHSSKTFLVENVKC